MITATIQQQRFCLNEFGLLHVSGTDAERFLQGQLTCDVTKILPGQGQLAAHLNPQGRILSLFYLLKEGENYYLLMPQRLVALAQEKLHKYALFYKVTLTPEPISSPSSFHITPLEIVFSLDPHQDGTPDTSDAFKTNLIQNKIATLYPETSGTFLPHELQLPQLGAVSFNKGCYTGQEIVARMEYKGKSKKVLTHQHFPLKNKPAPGATLYNEQNKEIGIVVDSTEDQDKAFALLLFDNENQVNPSLHFERPLT